jgi:hypothetical protein
VRGLTADDILRLPVRVRGIQLGRAVDLLLHPTQPQALGVDVLCGDERHRFLPLSAATIGDQELEAASPLVLLDLHDDSFYRREARPLSVLRGQPVGEVGVLQDVVLGDDWSIEELLVEEGGGVRQVPLDGIALPPRRREKRRAPWLPRRRRR